MKRLFGGIAVAGVAAFTCLYFYAAALYSSGTRLDQTGRGYQHLHNYWCDLYGTVTYTGEANPARPFAMAATLVMTATLILFFLSVPALFEEFPWLGRMVCWTGTSSMLLASLIFTPVHDAVITFGAPLGAAAIAGTCVGLWRKRAWGLLALALVAVIVSMGDYTAWKLSAIKFYQPMIQKTAFTLVFLWVVMTSLCICRQAPARATS